MIIADISHHKTVTDWDKLKQNSPFLISKATENVNYIDPTLNRFISECEKREIPYWLYCYLRKGGELEQAEFMVKTCQGKTGTHFIGYCLDIEAGNDAGNVKEAMDYIASLGKKFMIYTGYHEFKKYRELIESRPEECAWWESRYGKNDGQYNSNYPSHAGADLHQYTDKGSIPGVSGRCDISRLTGEKPLEWFEVGEKPDASGKTGVVTVDGLCVRKGPGTNHEIIMGLDEGTKVQILDSVINENGKMWCKIQYKGTTGFCSRKYVEM